MKFRVFLVAFFLMSSVASALAAGPYIGVAGGATFTHEGDASLIGAGSATAEYDPGLTFTGSVGYLFDDPTQMAFPFRLEFEFGYKNADVDKISVPAWSLSLSDTKIKLLSYMVNAFYEVKAQEYLNTYLGVGAGLLDGELDIQGDKANDTEFGYQVIVGGTFHMSEHLGLDVSYRFMHAPSDFSKEGANIKYMSSNVLLGLRYSF